MVTRIKVDTGIYASMLLRIPLCLHHGKPVGKGILLYLGKCALMVAKFITSLREFAITIELFLDDLLDECFGIGRRCGRVCILVVVVVVVLTMAVALPKRW
jgi:hypothetical protein